MRGPLTELRAPLTDSEQLKVLELYKTGQYSNAELARKFDKCEQAIYRLLKKHGLKAKSRFKLNEQQIKELIELHITNKYSFPELGKKFNLSGNGIREVLSRRGYKARPVGFHTRIYKVNENFFDNIDSESKSYVLGFLYADGCNSKNRCIIINLQEQDKEILEKIRDLLSPDRPLSYIDRSLQEKRGSFKNAQNTYRLDISNKYMSERLSELGCTSAKTFTLTFPTWLDESLYPHFIRGFMDGDGYISKNVRIPEVSAASTIPFCQSLRDIWKNHLDVNSDIRPLSKGSENIVKLRVKGGKQVHKLLDWMYRDSTIYMDRKYQRYRTLVDYRRNYLIK